MCLGILLLGMAGRLALGLENSSVSDLHTSSLRATTNSLLAGTRFATEYYVEDSGTPGPTVMIVGGVHGNEPAGAKAAEVIRHWPITQGRLVVLPCANVLGLAANKRLIPNLDTNLNNLNRNYPRAGKEEGPRGELAEAIWNVALQFKPNWLLDLHEGFDFHQVNDASVGSSIIAFPDEKGRAAAALMLESVNATITNAELKFVLRDMPINGSLARAGGEHLKIPSMTLETTSKQPMEKRIAQHELMVHRLLNHLGMMGDALPASDFAGSGGTPKTKTANSDILPAIRVALYKGPGTGGAGPPSMMKKMNETNAPTSLTEVSAEEIRGGALTNYDVVIFGGGSGSKEAESLGEAGRDEVQKFVGNGGGYVGICAGAYLATANYPWSLKIINARTLSPKWQRGRAVLKMELTPSGAGILGGETNVDVVYHQGPVVGPASATNLPPYETLAYFRTEVASNDTPKGIMINSPAIFAGQFKSGKVICISPHPEQTPGLEDIVPNAVNWVAPRKNSVALKPSLKAE